MIYLPEKHEHKNKRKTKNCTLANTLKHTVSFRLILLCKLPSLWFGPQYDDYIYRSYCSHEERTLIHGLGRIPRKTVLLSFSHADAVCEKKGKK